MNKCDSSQQTMNPAHSNGEPCVFPLLTSINIRFVVTSPLQLQIKHDMKTSIPKQNEMIVPSLFQIAAQLEDFIPGVGLRKPAPTVSQRPFADLMLHPDKLEAALKIARSENDIFDAARTFSAVSARRAAPKTRAGRSMEKASNHSLAELKRTEFHLEAPRAASVKLAADFTDWEKFAIDMIRAE